MNLGKEPASLGRVDVIRETEKAILVELTDRPTVHGKNPEAWIPRSVICEDSEVGEDASEGDEGELFVHQWFAEKEGLE